MRGVRTRAVRAEEELAAAGHEGVEQRPAVLGRLGHGLAEAEDVADGVVDDQAQVVRRDGARDGVAALADGVAGFRRGDVLEDDAQLGEARVDVEQRREELALGVEHADVLGRVGGDLAVDVEDHVDLLHGGEGGEEGLVGDDAAGRVGRRALWVGLHARDAGLLGLADDVGGDGLVEEEGDEVVDGGVDGLEALAVGDGGADGGQGRDQVGHDHDAVAATGADCGSDDLAEVAITEMDMAESECQAWW